MNAESRQIVRATLTRLGFARDSDCFDGDRYVGELPVGKSRVPIAITIGDFDFVSLPTIELLAVDDTSDICTPHIYSGNSLCYAQPDTLILDRYDPGGSVLRCMEQAKQTLALPAEQALEDVIREMPSYWQGIPVYIDDLHSGQRHATLATITRSDDSTAIILAREGKRLAEFAAALNGSVDGAKRCLLVWSDQDIEPVAGAARPANLERALFWLSQQSAVAFDTVYAQLKSFGSDAILCMVIAPNGTFGFHAFAPVVLKSNVGKGIRPNRLAALTLKQSQDVEVMRYVGDPIGQEFVFSRNIVGRAGLGDLAIAVVGCGTIGSHLIKFLAQSGAGFGDRGALKLIDSQLLSPQNLGRHLLGFPYIGINKAKGLADEIARLYPDCNTSAYTVDLRQVWPQIRDVDLLFDATGEEPVSQLVNAEAIECLKAGEGFPVRIHASVIGNGVAAQAFLADGLSGACYKCLEPKFGENSRYSPLKNPKDTAVIVDAQCGDGAYVPFSVSAPATAASLGLELALDWADGGEFKRLRTVTFDFERGKIVKPSSPASVRSCLACGGEASVQTANT